MRDFLASQRKCSVCRIPLRHVEWIRMEGGFVVHRKFVNAIQHTAEEEEKGTSDNRISRWVRNSLERQRTGGNEVSARSQEVLGEEDATWLREVVIRAQSMFTETGAPQAVVPAQDEPQPPTFDAANAIQRATYTYGAVLRYSLETR